jgi:hypothetical protein
MKIIKLILGLFRLKIEVTGRDIHDACMSYRHDYGILPAEAQEQLREEAINWLLIWGKTITNKKITVHKKCQ